MNPGLLVPLTLLPGTVPVGAVVRATLSFCYGRRAVVVLPPCKTLPYMVCVALLGDDDDEDTGQVIAFNIEHLSLDLSEPPTEDTGRPTHVDGVVVLAGMMALALGLGEQGRWQYNYDTARLSGICIGQEREWVVSAPGSVWDIQEIIPAHPAFATLDRAALDASRLLLAAVARTKPWEDQGPKKEYPDAL